MASRPRKRSMPQCCRRLNWWCKKIVANPRSRSPYETDFSVHAIGAISAKFVRGKETVALSQSQSTCILPGAVHRLENPGKIDLEIVEVQSGTYPGEGDIVRFEDVYRREDKQ
jgi:hypothetical protein